MCSVTEQVLWSADASRHALKCRVGSGNATYHRFDPTRRQHQITYGTRMIEAKHRPDTASGWLSTREITQRGYFGGELSALNLLAHTCCHEFAHLLQHNAGQRYRGSVHNQHFYGILDDLHEQGQAEACRERLVNLAMRQNLSISDQAFVLRCPIEARTTWAVGDAVAFDTSTREVHGTIVRVNRKTCTVQSRDRWRQVRYRVPMPLLRAIITA